MKIKLTEINITESKSFLNIKKIDSSIEKLALHTVFHELINAYCYEKYGQNTDFETDSNMVFYCSDNKLYFNNELAIIFFNKQYYSNEYLKIKKKNNIE